MKVLTENEVNVVWIVEEPSKIHTCLPNELRLISTQGRSISSMSSSSINVGMTGEHISLAISVSNYAAVARSKGVAVPVRWHTRK